ncbi:MAG: DUF5067 domain-containing protein [Clostridia bacterium]|nr:DUF5067 domain-containing protein [Clostridia bacterium]
MSFCTECGRSLPDTAIFCPNCGHRCATPTADFAEDPKQDQNAYCAECSGYGDTAGDQTQYFSQSGPNCSNYKQTPEIPQKNDRNKAVVIVVCTVLVLIIIAAALIISIGSSYSNYTGYWVSRQVTYGGDWYSSEMYGQQVDGMFSVQIEENGNISLSSDFSDSASSGTWEKNQSGLIAQFNGEDVYFIYDKSEKTLALEYGDGVYIIFERTEDENSAANPSDTPATGTNTVAGSGTVDSYYISVIGAEEFSDVDGNAAVRIYYEFTNNGGHETCAGSSISYSAVQDGKNLSGTYTWDDTEVYGNDKLYIRPGVTIQCCCEFKYDPAGGGVDFTVTSASGDESGGSVTATYLPGEFPGAPAPFVAETYDDPQWTLSLPSEAGIDDFYISVMQAELTTDYYDTPAIRVYYEFTNNSDYDCSLNDALYTSAYQDGIELEYTSELVGLLSDENYFTAISPGQTVSVSCVFILRNTTSPVEAEVESYSSYDAAGQTYDIQ